MKRRLALLSGVALCLLTLVPLTQIRRAQPPAERLGYIPSPEVTYITSMDHQLLVSQLLFYSTIFYYGAMIERPDLRPDFRSIYAYLDTSTRLNPYNIDSYYFAQAVLTWDGGMVKEVNELLERGAKKRQVDFYLPLFLGFNHSYFLNNYEKAAQYYAQAAQINPQDTYLATLSARLLYQADKTHQAIAYLESIYRGTSNESVRKTIRVRIDALQRISLLERAVAMFRERTGHDPETIDDLVSGGILKGIPPDPYGGKFFFDKGDRRIKTTSKLAFGGRAK
ncbi:hypothetical protein ANAEL_05348 [Anaerolineales bacterium]|nr:hypothetical protein ANAEL_05348 [Anaerolineales bacterium]